MTKLFLSLLLFPILSFASEPSTEMTPTGWVFLVSSWIFILVWNGICFAKLLKKK